MSQTQLAPPGQGQAVNAQGAQLCPCGSGLRTARCCGMNAMALPPPESTRHLIPLVERAVQAHRQGATETAERLCLDVLELAPDRPVALHRALRDPQGAGQAGRRRGADPPHRRARSQQFLGHQRAGPAAAGQGRLAEAEMHARNAVRIAPENPQAHNLMGMIMTEAQRPQIGEYHYRRVLELSQGARSDPARQPGLEPEEPGPHGRRRRDALRGIRRRRAGDPPDAARLGAAGGSRPQIRRRRQACSTAWRSCGQTIPGVQLITRGAAGADEAPR